MLLNIVLKQISNLLIIALCLVLHWQFRAGFAGGASSCERLEELCTLGNICRVVMMGRRTSQIWKSSASAKGFCPAVCGSAAFHRFAGLKF